MIRPTPSTRQSVFISYSHRDDRLRKELETHLALLRREGYFAVWDDRDIDAGSEWEREISQHLETAHIVLLLVSSDFIASNYCFSKEMTRALERHHAGQARVVPILLRPCDWQTAPFGKLQALPANGRPVVRFPNRDEGWLQVVQGLRGVVNEQADSALSAKWCVALNLVELGCNRERLG